MSFYYQKKHKCGMEIAEETCKKEYKKECKKDGSRGREVVDFKYARNGRGPEPNLFPADGAPGALALTSGEETQVAIITFKDVQKRSKIELKGLLHLLTVTSPGAGLGTAVVRIRKLDGPTFSLSSAEEIYRSGDTPIVPFAGQVTPLNALDVDDDFRECEESVSYVLTVEATFATGAVSLVNPITFTGTEYN